MDALEYLSHYRDVDPVDDDVVTAAVDAITSAVTADHRDQLAPTRKVWSRRLSRGHRIAIAAGTVLTVAGAGSGIAAATGLFNPSQPPQRARAFMSSPDPAKMPGATLQLSIPGPDGTTLQVVTYNVRTSDQIADCVALGIIGPDGRPELPTGYALCSGGGFEPGGAVPTLRQASPSLSLQIWKAPSGADYYLIFGQAAIPGVVRVTLSGSDGVTAATELATPNGYVIYIPAASFVGHSHLSFFDKSGKVVFSQDLNS